MTRRRRSLPAPLSCSPIAARHAKDAAHLAPLQLSALAQPPPARLGAHCSTTSLLTAAAPGAKLPWPQAQKVGAGAVQGPVAAARRHKGCSRRSTSQLPFKVDCPRAAALEVPTGAAPRQPARATGAAPPPPLPILAPLMQGPSLRSTCWGTRRAAAPKATTGSWAPVRQRCKHRWRQAGAAPPPAPTCCCHTRLPRPPCAGPFSHRVLLALEERELPYTPNYVDVQQKPDW